MSIKTRVTPALPDRSTRSEVRRRRFFGLFGSQAPQPSAGRGTPADEPQPRMVNFRVMPRTCLVSNSRGRLGADGRRHFAEQPEEIFGRLPGDLLERNAARLGQDLCGLDHISRFVALAAERIRREIGRVGFDQNPIGRQVGCNRAQCGRVFEGQDAAEGDIAAERDGAAGEVGAAGEAMQHSREGALPGFFLKNARGVGVGFARVNDQRQSGRARRRDMGAKAPLLRVARAVVVVIVETRFADRHDFRMPRVGDEIVHCYVQLLVRVMRMRADRAIDVRKTLRDRQHAGKAPHARRDRDQRAPSPPPRARIDDRVNLAGKIRKIEMAMTVDQHRSVALLLSGARFRLDITREYRRGCGKL